LSFARWVAVAAAVVLLSAPSLDGVQATAPDGMRLDYRVLRDGFEIGSHKTLFRHDGPEEMTVETEIRITVKLFFITLYRYRLDSVETWRGDRLVALESSTDDDGDLYAVRAIAEGEGLVIDGVENRWTAPATIMPTSLWRREMAQGSLLLGVEQDEALAVAFREAGRETVTAGGGEVSATKLVVSGELERELWYDDDSILVQMRLIGSDGSTITYERQ
jgi:hypothetical protein